ncbi:MAG TPA: heme ABC exporter ATP-binding protein CcmA [Acidimicrobiales bacterium]|nr:heme ABC exporter ATP-binding protein CcmA [Acidimicrobiales bacterium]
MAPAIRLRSAVALLGRFPALAGVDLDVQRGEIVLAQGPNGAGKTSLLRACAGLLAVTDGEAVVLGHDLRKERRQVRRHVGFLGSEGFLYDDLTVDDNVRFAVRAAKADTARIEPTLERLGLSGRLRSVAAGKLSTGQKRRVALATVVAKDADLWLLDEPHAGLDAEGRNTLDDLIRDAAARGRTVVVASHEAVPAHRIVHVAGGEVKEPARVA